MSFQQLRSGINLAWDRLVNGWSDLYDKAAEAITEFIPHHDEQSTDKKRLSTQSNSWGVLAAEVFDDENQVIVHLEVPGMEADDFKLKVINNTLIVKGHKQSSREHQQGRFHISERAYGIFERQIPLPEKIIGDNVSASYERGVLRVELPRVLPEQEKTTRIKVH